MQSRRGPDPQGQGRRSDLHHAGSAQIPMTMKRAQKKTTTFGDGCEKDKAAQADAITATLQAMGGIRVTVIVVVVTSQSFISKIRSSFEQC